MIGIITVNWRGYEVTHHLIEKLLGGDYQAFKIVVVNNSPDEITKFDQDTLFQDFRIQVIHSPDNVGYAGGINIGLNKLLTYVEITHFLLVNNDIEVEKIFLEQMLAGGKDNCKIYAPLVLYQDTGLVQNTGGKIHIWLGGTVNLNKNVPIAQVVKLSPDFLSGCVLFFHRNVLDKVGIFDETYGSYYEDVDYCLRARKAGLDIEILWTVYARHFHSYSTKDDNRYKVYLLNRNQIIFAKKHLAFFPRLVFISAAILRGFIQNFIRQQALSYFQGVKDGLDYPAPVIKRCWLEKER